ncbi:WRKY transcription factor 71-like [Phragmites australis]|uniref:WRKY transcription factor 71-like n=1 Tax=Phragmites australis TaxID=29695 RepID=UPI002D78B508|nr:WRKY transcription factor 71-like [Phragmites australis]
MASTSQLATIGKGEEKEEEAAAAGNGSQLVLPEDGYEWNKYGQKFIKNIQKIRTYFRCRDKRCGAKKKVEWQPRDPSSDLRVVYEGAHRHGSPPSATAGSGGGGGPNQYELSAQYFGGARTQ